ncbi:TolC family outer membrane protein [Caulobacter sp. BP25]|uniref:TolC family outer membrane protein n=1 Tax=Caulobacter sp. BP25 TaxID=2048900 RepID=UPI000C12CF5D|nr:TolC family outer membrane protein [Caulobacter sp. BP25]PHY18820.1 channel protein TolC [Caulobacter sp. BP25]
MRTALALTLLASVATPLGASAMTLPEAIVLARRANPGLAQVQAQSDAASARLTQARAGRLPSLTLSAESASGTTDLSGFFGFGQSDVSPRAASLQLRQSLFSGGGVSAAITQAREGKAAALAQVGGATAMLSAEVASAYVGVLSAQDMVALSRAQLAQMETITSQAQLRFKSGEIPRTDLDQATARLAESRAGLARAEGQLARSRAHFVSVVGAEPDGLEAVVSPPATPASLDEAIAAASESSPMLLAAQAAERAAQAGVRYAKADRLPSLALTATASTARDQFFPGYSADGVTVGVQGRWTLFSGGAVSGRIDEAGAALRSAQASLNSAQARVRETVIVAWGDVATARAVILAATDQASAATSALDSVRNEVRVGQRPVLDLLDAEREALAAQSGLVTARGEVTISSYRLNALLHGQ